MRFRFREVERNIEREKVNQTIKEGEGYKKIKPETGMTVSEANNFWDSIFAQEVEG